VAIKLITQPDPDDAERFRREAESLAMVSHPAIVEVYDCILGSEGVSYLVMAYVAGDNIADYMAQKPQGVLPPVEALDLLLPAASALVELHAHGILHRDIKPANLVRYVRADGRAAVKLVDFGIVRRRQDPGLTAEGLVVGTPPYLSPEVILGKKHSEASDVYSFGAMLFELLTGDPPHGRDDLHLVLKRATQDDVRLPPDLMGTALGALLLRLLAREDQARPSMQVVLEELERIRLGLLMDNGSMEAALQATRSLSAPLVTTGKRIQGAAAAEAQTAALGVGPQTAATAAIDAAGASRDPEREPGTAMISHPPGPAAHGATRSSRLPWAVAGAAIAVALGTVLFFSLRAPGERGTGRPRADAPTTAGALRRAGARPMGEPNAAPDPRSDKPAQPRRDAGAPVAENAGAADSPGKRSRAPELDKILKQCTDRIKAYKLFRQATFWFRMNQRKSWVRAAFGALLKCRHTSLGQKRWVLHRLAKLHAKAGECSRAKQRWEQYTVVARKLGVPPSRPPPCSPRRKKGDGPNF